MFFTDIVKRSGRSLKSSKLRTLLTALAIAVGAFTLSLTLAASNGLRDYTNKLISNNFDPAELLVGRDKEIANTGAPGSDPQEYDPSVGSIRTGGQSAGIPLRRLTMEDIEKLRAKPYVDQVRENFNITIGYVTREGQKKYTGAIEAYNQAQKPELVSGQLPKSGDIENEGALIPDSYIGLLGFKDANDAIGKTVEVSLEKPFSIESATALIGSLQSGASLQSVASSAQPETKLVSYKIVGVSKKSSVSFAVGLQPLRIGNADARALYDYTVKGTNDYNKFLYASVRIKDGNNQNKIDEAKDDLTKDGFYSIGVKELQKTITQFVNILTIMVGVFGLITVIASVFGIVNTQYISVLERTREIGLMKALGISRGKISQLFMLEATWIGFLGGLIGVILGSVTGVIVNPTLTKKLDLGEGNSLLIFKPFQLLLLIFALMLVATVAGWLPSRKAAKLDPIEALRTE